MSYKTQEEIYTQWFNEAKAQKGLIDVKFQPGDIKLTSKEEFYREANHFNDQADSGLITPLFKVVF
ncbi:hypothetical protein [Sulfuricurvum sp.]|uniref:hypothetical protein n=1 Tax=Sulfuricurvum sp. TaxID=2025608 RepID=UPI003BB17671